MKSIKLLVIFSLLASFTFAQVGINTETPDASSALHIDSTTGGLLPPRLTTAERDAIDDPVGVDFAEGLIIFNTDTESLEIYTGSGWNKLGVETDDAKNC